MKKNKYFLFLFFMLFVIIYLFSIAPAYNSDDSPETTLAFYSLGIQHPPGYPLNTLIGKLFTFIPLGSLMFRANLMALFFNILTGFLLFLIMYKFIIDYQNDVIRLFISIIGVIFFLFSISIWRQGISAKGSIYALNSFFTCFAIYSVLNVRSGIKYFYFFCFIYGLGMCNHWTSMIVILPAFVLFIYFEYKNIKVKNVLCGLMLFLTGLSVYIFIFLRSKTEPIYAWGDTRTIKDFIWLISRAQYAGIETKHKFSDTISLLTYYLKHFTLNEYKIFGLLFIPGAYFLFEKKRNVSVLFFLSYLLLTFSVVSFATPPENTQWLIKPYLASANIYVSIFLCYFIFYVINKLNGLYGYLFLIITFIGSFVFLLFSNPGYSRYFIGYDYSKNMTKNICCNSILMAEGDMNIGAALYETLVNKADFVPLIPVVIQYDWYKKQASRNFKGRFNLPPDNPDMKSYIESIIYYNRDKNIYYTNVATSQWVKDLKSYPYGVFYKITNDEKVIVNDFYFLTGSFRGKIDKTSEYDEFTQRLVFDNYATGYFALGEILRNHGKLVEATKYFNYGLLFQQNSAAYINLGLVYYQLNNLDMAENSWKMALKIDPKNSIAYSNMAFIYIARNDIIDAKKMIEKALFYNPDNQTALNLKQKLNERYK
jgi:tetratricopeptide (TPR) repeat protein